MRNGSDQCQMSFKMLSSTKSITIYLQSIVFFLFFVLCMVLTVIANVKSIFGNFVDVFFCHSVVWSHGLNTLNRRNPNAPNSVEHEIILATISIKSAIFLSTFHSLACISFQAHHIQKNQQMKFHSMPEFKLNGW